LAAGAARVVIGTVAIEQPEMVDMAVRTVGAERIVVAVDARDGWVATHGWETVRPIRAVDLVRRLVPFGVRRILATDIGRDGTLTRPNVELLTELASVGLAVIASGGVGSRRDLETLARIPGVEAVVVGRALYEGRLSFERPEDWIVDEGAG
ncbi:MAG: HisA/HisF-related TIM barrel protein, partial [Thermomicrobium sp.]|nr:HisA/HisF-related TIM barrel protein [Thermomicrobium sp.]